MSDANSNPNLEWRKGSIGVKETITRKTNIAKAVEYDAKKQKLQNPVKSPPPAALPNGLKKIRKKIKDVYDDDEDEEEYITIANTALLEQDHSTLVDALSENEKKQLKQQETLHHTKMQQDAGKLESIMQTERILKQAGLPKMTEKVRASAMQDVRINQDTMGKIIHDTLPQKLHLPMKRIERMSIQEKEKLVNGVSLMKQVGGEKALQGTKVEELLVIGDKKTGEKEVAKIILEKTGRKKTKGASKTKQQSAQKELEKQVINTRKRNQQRCF